MHEMQPIVTHVRGICPTRGSSRLRCAKTAELIKMLFGVNTLGGPRDIVLHGGPDHPTYRGGRPTFKSWNPPSIPGTAAGDLKFSMHIEGCGP